VIGSTNICSVTDLLPQDTEDEPFHYTFKVQCTSCREVHPNWVTVNRHVGSISVCTALNTQLTPFQEMNEQQGSRGEANFVWKCQNCKVNKILALKGSFPDY
jgi:hypothetical protein